jgi:hypothetical protein
LLEQVIGMEMDIETFLCSWEVVAVPTGSTSMMGLGASAGRMLQEGQVQQTPNHPQQVL